MTIFTLPETLRALVGDGTIPPPPYCRRPQDQWKISRKRREQRRNPDQTVDNDEEMEDAVRPPKKRYDPLGSFKALLEPDVAALLMYAGMVFASMYAVLSTFSVKLENDYGFNTIESGLCYLPMGFGSLFTAVFGGRILDWDLKRTMKRVGFVQKHPRDVEGFAIERCRCRLLPISYSFMIFALRKHASLGFCPAKLVSDTDPFATRSHLRLVNGEALVVRRATRLVRFCRIWKPVHDASVQHPAGRPVPPRSGCHHCQLQPHPVLARRGRHRLHQPARREGRARVGPCDRVRHEPGLLACARLRHRQGARVAREEGRGREGECAEARREGEGAGIAAS